MNPVALSANEVWVNLVRHVVRDGHPVSPRDLDTVEVVGDTIVVDMRYPVVTARERRIGYRFMAAEAAWILAGDDTVEPVARYAPYVRQFSDDGTTFFGAYGPRFRAQLPYVVDVLKRDPETRQAVVRIWRDAPPPTRDVPCTLTCQFLVRHGYMDCVVTMRSSDAWLGVPYDVFSFSMIAGAVLAESGVDAKLGRLVNFAGSRHLYVRDYDGVRRVISNPEAELSYAPFAPRRFSGVDDLSRHLRAVAERDVDAVNGTWFTETMGVERGVKA